jgi:hypothetical protein
VIGASANLSLTTLIAKSPCLSDDFLTLIVAFIKRCFAKNPYRFDETLDNSILDFIINEEFDEDRIDDLLNEFENPAKILDTNWYAIKPMYEKKYRELINDKEKFVSINDIRLSRDCVKKSIKYLREIYRHRLARPRLFPSITIPASRSRSDPGPSRPYRWQASSHKVRVNTNFVNNTKPVGAGLPAMRP